MIVKGFSTLYVELTRGIPLLVQLMWWYFSFPSVIQFIGNLINFDLFTNYRANAVIMAIIGLSFCYGAYCCEVFRAGIYSIPKGQMEAARSLGLNFFQTFAYVILPQTIRTALPMIGNQLISLLKDSSLVSVVAVADITRRGREFMSTNFNPLETWSIVALIYLIMTLLISRIINIIEKKIEYS